MGRRAQLFGYTAGALLRAATAARLRPDVVLSWQPMPAGLALDTMEAIPFDDDCTGSPTTSGHGAATGPTATPVAPRTEKGSSKPQRPDDPTM
ncbi:MAG: hypothetical protein GEU81_09450 [Nitriliruptorales bacterium]|nr:hypothetical protein [Nitriliruptorales bacterium]